MHKAPEWHCWLVLMLIEPLHCFKENLKKTHQGKPQKYTKAAPKSADQRFTSADISKKAHNGAASSLSMEHFVLRGCFTSRLFAPVRITGMPRTPCWKCQHCTKRLPGAQEALKHLLRERHLGSFQAAVRVLLSTSDGIIIPWAHSHFAVVFLTLGFYRSFAASLWEMTSPALSSISLIQKAAFKRAFKILLFF